MFSEWSSTHHSSSVSVVLTTIQIFCFLLRFSPSPAVRYVYEQKLNKSMQVLGGDHSTEFYTSSSLSHLLDLVQKLKKGSFTYIFSPLHVLLLFPGWLKFNQNSSMKNLWKNLWVAYCGSFPKAISKGRTQTNIWTKTCPPYSCSACLFWKYKETSSA